MAGSARELFKLYKLYGKMDLIWYTQDLAACVVVTVSETISSLASALGVLLLAARFGGVGGLSADEVLFMLGFYEVGEGLTGMLFGGGNVIEISRRVGRGQLDHSLIQPRPVWMQFMAEAFMPISGSGGLIAGIAILWIACSRLGIAATPGWIAALLLYAGCAVALMVGQGFFYGAAAFYRPVACEEISARVRDVMYLLGKYPLAGIPNWAMIALSTVLPAGLMAYVPSLVLLGKSPHIWYAYLPPAVAAAFLVFAFYFFRKGLIHYASFSCNRYSDYGHRS